ncbi:hypothetical protein ILUMI_11238 [Ignelater luminosus]|uniref:Uncharacterized protein n=1 Tax=Ignelater luminosus TaxID=2038154 RepID=A0A8K0GAQ0_IGNLU|nr:hypothetical protein ILUMI_11238 [Ignelater luminosus]
MTSSTILTFLFSLCVVAAVIGANYEIFTKQQLIGKFPFHDGNFQAHAAINPGYPEDCNSSIIPPDDGSGSYGDLTYYSKPHLNDKLLLREIFINRNVSSQEQVVFWNEFFINTCVTHVKALNFGRDRAFTRSIYVNNTRHKGGNVDINVLILANNVVRMFFEVVGHVVFKPYDCDFTQ